MIESAEQLYAIWAPEESRWSAWAKPVLFTYAPRVSEAADALPLLRVPDFGRLGDTAVIVDMPGTYSVSVGLALAQNGYRPVPLYNGNCSPGMIVDMQAIADSLFYGCEILRKAQLGPDAPPAFLLNADRMDHSDAANTPGRYDNRWSVVPQDMPSGEYLIDAGIRQVGVIADRIRDDLSHVLCRYQEAGLRLVQTPDVDGTPARVTVAKPPFYKWIWYRLNVFAGLRRNAAGGFGGIVPDPNTSGAYGGFG